jgi:hypothetical protein
MLSEIRLRRHAKSHASRVRETHAFGAYSRISARINVFSRIFREVMMTSLLNLSC